MPPKERYTGCHCILTINRKSSFIDNIEEVTMKDNMIISLCTKLYKKLNMKYQPEGKWNCCDVGITLNIIKVNVPESCE